mmetsp:Transcript_10107/g.19802  ORF Transcript_10107/g.19802 Transcript_10107/m.19802 type:complete len:90 (-) Transcript_10107:1194-1463(-)
MEKREREGEKEHLQKRNIKITATTSPYTKIGRTTFCELAEPPANPKHSAAKDCCLRARESRAPLCSAEVSQQEVKRAGKLAFKVLRVEF